MVDIFTYAARNNLKVTTRDSRGRITRVETGKQALARQQSKRRSQIDKQKQFEEERKQALIQRKLDEGAVNVLKAQAQAKGLDTSNIKLVDVSKLNPNVATKSSYTSSSSRVGRLVPVIEGTRRFENDDRIVQQKGFYSVNPKSNKLEFNRTFQLEADVKRLTRKIQRDAPKRVEIAKFGSVLEPRSTPTKDSKAPSKPTLWTPFVSKFKNIALYQEAKGISEKNIFKKYGRAFLSIGATGLSEINKVGDISARLVRSTPSAFNLTKQKASEFIAFAKTPEGQKAIKDNVNKFIKSSSSWYRVGIKGKELIQNPALQAAVVTATLKAVNEFKKRPITTTFSVISQILLFELAAKNILSAGRLIKKYGSKVGSQVAKEIAVLKQTKPNIFLTESQKALPQAQRLKIIKSRQSEILKTRAKFRALERQERRINAVKNSIQFDKKLDALPKTVAKQVITKYKRIIRNIKNFSPTKLKKDLTKLLKEARTKRLKTKAIKKTRAKFKAIERKKLIKSIPSRIKTAIISNVRKYTRPIKRRLRSFKDFFRTINVKPKDVNLQITESQLKSLARLREQQSKSANLLSKVNDINEFIKIPIDKTFTVNNIRAFINFLKRNPKQWSYVLVEEGKNFARVVIDGKNVLVKLISKLDPLKRDLSKVDILKSKSLRKSLKSSLKKGTPPKTKQFYINGQLVTTNIINKLNNDFSKFSSLNNVIKNLTKLYKSKTTSVNSLKAFVLRQKVYKGVPITPTNYLKIPIQKRLTVNSINDFINFITRNKKLFSFRIFKQTKDSVRLMINGQNTLVRLNPKLTSKKPSKSLLRKVQRKEFRKLIGVKSSNLNSRTISAVEDFAIGKPVKVFQVNKISDFLNFIKRNSKRFKLKILEQQDDFARILLNNKKVLVRLTKSKSRLRKAKRKEILNLIKPKNVNISKSTINELENFAVGKPKEIFEVNKVSDFLKFIRRNSNRFKLKVLEQTDEFARIILNGEKALVRLTKSKSRLRKIQRKDILKKIIPKNFFNSKKNVSEITTFFKKGVNKELTVNNINNFLLNLRKKGINYKLVEKTDEFARLVINNKNVFVKLTKRQSKILKGARKTIRAGQKTEVFKAGTKPKTKQYYINGQKIEIAQSGIKLSEPKEKRLVKTLIDNIRVKDAKKKLGKNSIKHSNGKGLIQITKIDPKKVNVARNKLNSLKNQIKNTLDGFKKAKRTNKGRKQLGGKPKPKTTKRPVSRSRLMKDDIIRTPSRIPPQIKVSQNILSGLSIVSGLSAQLSGVLSKQEYSTKQRQIISQALQTLQKIKQGLKQSTAQDSLLKSSQIVDTVSKVAVTQAQAQAIESAIKPILKTVQITITKPVKTPKIFIPRLPKTWDYKLPAGYVRIVNVLVRSKGRIKEIPLKTTPNRALKRVSSLVDNTTTRSFQLKIVGIKKASDIAKPKLLKFRSKISRGTPVLNVVEKSKYAIDTKGEKRGLKLSQLLKSRNIKTRTVRKKLKKVKKQKKK